MSNAGCEIFLGHCDLLHVLYFGNLFRPFHKVVMIIVICVVLRCMHNPLLFCIVLFCVFEILYLAAFGI